jgi:hypothetical protein
MKEGWMTYTNGHGGNGHGGRTPDEPPPEWPIWEQRIDDPDGRRWRVRTIDVLEAPGQIHPRLAKTLAETKGRFRTTVISPRGGRAKDIYVPDRDQAIAYHRRMVRAVREGQLYGGEG